jgi:hypothetical protein
MKLLFLSFLLLSCTKYASITKDSVGVTIHDVHMKVNHAQEIKWKVGNFREQVVSQSFTVMIEMPKLNIEDLDLLHDTRGIDAWILRVIMQRGSKSQDLGSLYTLFRPRQSSRVTSSAASSVSFKVYYAAAYASERFRNSKCPPFSHDKKIVSIDIDGSEEAFDIPITQAKSYQEKSQLIELNPSSFNGGNSLIADYYIEIAPYDSQKKLIYSPFKRIPNYVSIKAEDSVNIKECAGVHSEMNPPGVTN